MFDKPVKHRNGTHSKGYSWCCTNKNLKELRNYYKYLPKYWNKLKEFQSKTDRPFRNNKDTIYDLEERFDKEKI